MLTKQIEINPLDKAKGALLKPNPSIETAIQQAALAIQKVSIVKDEISKAELTGYIKLAKDVRAQVAKLRTNETGKLDDLKKLFMQAEKDISSQLDEYIASGTTLIQDYNNEVIRKQREETARIKAEEEKALRRLSSPKSIAAVETATQAKLQTVAAPTGIRMVWDFEVIDPDKVSAEFLMVDTAKVKAAIKEGVRQIAGIEIKQVASTVIR